MCCLFLVCVAFYVMSLKALLHSGMRLIRKLLSLKTGLMHSKTEPESQKIEHRTQSFPKRSSNIEPKVVERRRISQISRSKFSIVLEFYLINLCCSMLTLQFKTKQKYHLCFAIHWNISLLFHSEFSIKLIFLFCNIIFANDIYFLLVCVMFTFCQISFQNGMVLQKPLWLRRLMLLLCFLD